MYKEESYKQVIDIVNQVKNSPIELNEALVRMAILSSAKLARLKDMEDWVSVANSKNFAISGGVYLAMVQAYGKVGLYQAMENVLSMMKAQTLPIQLPIYNAILDTYGKQGMLNEMKRVILDMKREGIELNTFCYTSIMGAYVNLGKAEEAIYYYKEMRAQQLPPDRAILSILKKLFESTDEKVPQLLEDLRKTDQYADRAAYFVEIKR